MRFIITVVICYLLYKLIFDFIIPVSRASNQIKKNIRNAQAQQQQYYEQQQASQAQQQQKQTPPASDAEYIDYEEVK